MTADLSVLPGPHLVLLAGGTVDLAGLPCGLCSVAVLPGPHLPALALSTGRAAFVCDRCARQVDPVVATLAESLNTISALVSGLGDVQHRAGLKHALKLLAARIPEPPLPEGAPCPSFPAGSAPPDPSESSTNP